MVPEYYSFQSTNVTLFITSLCIFEYMRNESEYISLFSEYIWQFKNIEYISPVMEEISEYCCLEVKYFGHRTEYVYGCSNI